MYRAAIGSLVLLICCEGPALAQDSETPQDILAAHLRTQGYPCDAPRSARRDLKASRPDGTVWVVACENARYRVRLIPDMADVVEPF